MGIPDVYGCSEVFVVAAVFWAIVCAELIGDHGITVVITMVLSLGTAKLWSMFGWLTVVVPLLITGLVFVGLLVVRLRNNGQQGRRKIIARFTKKPIIVLLMVGLSLAIFKWMAISDWIMSIWEVFMDIIPFLALAALLICAALSEKDSNQQPQPQLPPIPPSTFMQMSVPNTQPTVLYHGGPMTAVMDIFLNNRILVNSGAFWMAAEFPAAAGYAVSKGNGNGGVVELKVSPSVMLNSLGEGIFIAPINYAMANQYYRIQGITPVRVLDHYGTQVAP